MTDNIIRFLIGFLSVPALLAIIILLTKLIGDNIIATILTTLVVGSVITGLTAMNILNDINRKYK